MHAQARSADTGAFTLPMRTLSSSVKKVIVYCNCSACSPCAPSSSVVAVNSSEAVAFCCEVWLSCPMTLLIWLTPGRLFGRRRGDFMDRVGGLAHRRHRLCEQRSGAFGPLDPRGGKAADFLRGDLRAS